MSTQQKQRKNKQWPEHDESILIDLWTKKAPILIGPRKKTKIYEEMRVELLKHSITASTVEIKSKLGILKRKYMQEKERAEERGEVGTSWKHFSKVGAIINLKKENGTKANDLRRDSCTSQELDEEKHKNTEEDISEEMSDCSENSLMYELTEIEDSQDAASNIQSVNFGAVASSDAEKAPSEYELFAKLISKELCGLDDDLRVDTKRKIYNIICDANMIQIKRYKRTT